MIKKLRLNESLFFETESSDSDAQATIDITTVPNLIGVLSGDVDPFDQRTSSDASSTSFDVSDSNPIEADRPVTESVLVESKYDALETGTCFQFKNHPSVYIMEVVPDDKMTIFNKQTGKYEEICGKFIHFRAYKHPYANWWKCPFDWLQEKLVARDISILSQPEIDNLNSFTDNTKDKFKLPTP